LPTVPADCIGDAGPLEGPPTKPATVPESVPEKEAAKKRHATYCQVKQLQGQGHGKKAIARHLHISRNTVKKYFRQEVFAPRPSVKRSNLLDFESYLHLRWQQGSTCVRTLFKEIQAMNYNGSYTILTVLLAAYPKATDLQTPGHASLPPAVRAASFSNRSLSIALCLPEADWKNQEKPLLEKLLEKVPLLDQVRLMSLEFRRILNQKQGDKLQNLCEIASELAGFKGFVYGIKQDFDAIYQAMTSNWSSGQVEGQVNRLKNIKRQMYGKVSFELLRIRVLAENCTHHLDWR
jgi:hypothetical protein